MVPLIFHKVGKHNPPVTHVCMGQKINYTVEFYYKYCYILLYAYTQVYHLMIFVLVLFVQFSYNVSKYGILHRKVGEVLAMYSCLFI